MKFQKAIKRKSKLRLCLASPSGGGKTLGALLVAIGLGGKIAVVDTERGSAQLYSDAPELQGAEFDVLELTPPYTPERYIAAIKAAEEAGYESLILDSITHEWNGSGGVLEIVDSLARSKFKGNSYAAWNEGTPRHRAFIDAMLQSNLHIIATMRTKAAYVEGERNGKRTIEKVGTAPEQRDGIEYEFTAVLDISLDGNIACATKDRTRLFSAPHKLTIDDGKRLITWLESGVEAKPQPSEAEEIQSRLADHRAAIEASATIEELTAAWNDAITWAKSTRDMLIVQSITAIKDARKSQLTEQAA